MPGDIVSGRYGLTSPIQAALGIPGNAAQGNLPVRSNVEYMGLNDLTDAAASLVSGKLTYVVVPVDIGQPISKVRVCVGATAASTPTHSWAALYSGALTKAKLLGEQSADGTTTAIPASEPFVFTLAKKYIIQPADAEFGYILAAISVTGTAVPSLSSGAIAVACQYKRFGNAPLFWAAKSGSALGATAPSEITLASAEGLATPPEVYLE